MFQFGATIDEGCYINHDDDCCDVVIWSIDGVWPFLFEYVTPGFAAIMDKNCISQPKNRSLRINDFVCAFFNSPPFVFHEDDGTLRFKNCLKTIFESVDECHLRRFCSCLAKDIATFPNTELEFFRTIPRAAQIFEFLETREFLPPLQPLPLMDLDKIEADLETHPNLEIPDTLIWKIFSDCYPVVFYGRPRFTRAYFKTCNSYPIFYWWFGTSMLREEYRNHGDTTYATVPEFVRKRLDFQDWHHPRDMFKLSAKELIEANLRRKHLDDDSSSDSDSLSDESTVCGTTV